MNDEAQELRLKLAAAQAFNRELVKCLQSWMLYSIAALTKDPTETHERLTRCRLLEARDVTARILR
jgi:hypothetical protein